MLTEGVEKMKPLLFSVSRKGYDRDEVNAFLADLDENSRAAEESRDREIKRLSGENDVLRSRAEALESELRALGNRPDLFPSSPYVGKYTSKPPAHEIPEDYLADETFAAILKEAKKYVGYPYVWGGSSPSTSFDCSGFVSYVYNQCGWDFGRLGAQGLYNISTRTSSPKPGDLVFFTGTYDTPGISHVGIYVGDGWMLHCGDPISYANLNTSYWQSHFYAYGKLF